MSKLIYVVFKDRQRSLDAPTADRLARTLLPDNLAGADAQRFGDGGVAGLIVPANASVGVHGSSACLGRIFGSDTAWHVPRQTYPDGSFALFRSNASHAEIVSDVLASRTIWYFHGADVFIASTSQRAIVALLGRFELDASVVPWMLSAGTLGPGDGWDARLRRLGPNTSLVLDRVAWTVKCRPGDDPVFEPLAASDARHEKLLLESLEATFRDMALDGSKWALPLSGGYDSRAILRLMGDGRRPRTITWGDRAALDQKDNDAYIAARLAEHYALDHRYYELDGLEESLELEEIFDRFIACGEGRCDHVSGYMDGLETWKHLYEDGIRGVIRGDEAFGWKPVASPTEAMHSVDATLCSDYANLHGLVDGLPPQNWPQRLARRDKESAATWRDRLYQQYRIPVLLSALSDLKCSYVEIVNPLLSRRLVHRIRAMPDHLRTDKKTFKRLVRTLGPDVPFARHAAITRQKSIFARRSTANLVADELASGRARDTLPRALIEYILTGLATRTHLPQRRIGSVKAAAHRLARPWRRVLQKRAGRAPNADLDLGTLAFRAFLVSRTCALFERDAASLPAPLIER